MDLPGKDRMVHIQIKSGPGDRIDLVQDKTKNSFVQHEARNTTQVCTCLLMNHLIDSISFQVKLYLEHIINTHPNYREMQFIYNNMHRHICVIFR